MAGPAQSPTRMAGATLGDRLAAVRTRVSAAAEGAGRDPQAVRLIAVTKTFSTALAAEIVGLGVNDLGENRVQEAAAKIAELPADVRWHLIGHLQTNKASRAASLFGTVHSVDNLRVAQALSARRPEDMPALDVLVEVELTGIPGHTGAPPEELDALVAAVEELPRLRLRGLMTMAPLVDDVEAARPTFVRLRGLRDEVEQRLGRRLPELSMGVSNDFEVAVEEGATMVRLGRVLFGERPPRSDPAA